MANTLDNLSSAIEKSINKHCEEEVDRIMEQSIVEFRSKLHKERATILTKVFASVMEHYYDSGSDMIIKIPFNRNK